jgi:hypothetical protein
MGEMANALEILIDKPEGKRLLGRDRRRWGDMIKEINVTVCIGLFMRKLGAD